MNIAVDTRVLMNPTRTGVGEYTYELLNALFKIDKQNQYYLFYNSSKDVSKNVQLWDQENVHYVSTRWPNKIFNLFQKFFKYPKLDSLVKQDLDAWFSPNLNFTVISKKTKYILTIHDLSFEILPECFSLKRRMWHKIINPKKQCERADLILTPSENTKRDVVELYDVEESKVSFVRPGLCSNFGKLETLQFGGQAGNWKRQVKQKYNLPDKFILFLGTIEPRKNIEGIIEAFEKANSINNHYSLIIAGAKGWKYDIIMDKIEKTPGVRYLGFLDESEKQALYELASLFVYPSLYEGFGFPVLEAMACGTPVLTSNRTSLPEVAGNKAFLVNPHNTSEIASGMEMLLNGDSIYNKITEEAKKHAERFSWDETAREFLNLI
ncbi:glycosyltransferase family 4 protein [Patescibacteria group bacterium]|nr:glycosyltransferase family 4 protein [Patescibacteria group bacterium]